MSECVCEAVLLGRRPVQGTANSDSLAALIRLLLSRYGPSTSTRKCRLRCSRDGVEIRPVRRHEDEGFESDDDTVSQTSSSSSSCGLVEDQVPPAPGPEATSNDSANSSGASDNDEGDSSLTTAPQAHVQTQAHTSREFYVFNDVAFCHTDPAFPKVLVLVIKKKVKNKTDDVDSSAGLEAVVFQCNSVDDLKEVCAIYREFSRRIKMDLQFRYPHRRKESVVDTSSTSLYRNAFNDLQKTAPVSGVATNSSFFKTWLTNVPGKPPVELQSSETSRYNLVQRTDDDGVTHIEVSKAVAPEEDFVTSTASDEYSSIISISTPDVGNLFASSSSQSDVNTYPSLNESLSNSNSSEIDGVIRADVESSPTTSPTRTEACEKKESPNIKDDPPQRPQRGKYVKKNLVKAKDPETSNVKSKVSATKERGPISHSSKPPSNQEKVVRGQFIRVSVEQQGVPKGWQGHRLFSGDKPMGQMLSYPMWSRSRRSREDETDYRTGMRVGHQRRSRSSGGTGRRSTSPPPLTFRYVEPPPAHTPPHKRFFGKLREIASINNACVASLSRRRNSSGDLVPTAQFYQYLEPALKTNSSSNLKSVIKKKNYNENIEPKKVTFSAYATVQVVD